MSRYKVVSLNYISSGKNKTFVNLDISSDFQINMSYRILQGLSSSIAKRQCIVSEQKAGYEKKQNFIAKDTLGDIIGCSADMIVTLSDETQISKKEAYGISLSSDDDLPNTMRMMADNIDYSVSVSYEGEQIANEHSISSLLLDEDQPYREYVEGARMYFRIYTEKDYSSYVQKVQEYIEGMENLKNKTFIFENDTTDSGYKVNRRKKSSNVRPLYDILDVSLKSANTQQVSFVRSFDTYQHTEDLYQNQQEENPVQFCQSNGYTYVMTKPQENSLQVLKTSFLEQRETIEKQTWYNMGLKEDDSNGIIYYKTPMEISQNPNSPDFSMRCQQSELGFQTVQRFSMTDRYDYTNGNDYCNITQTKTFLDSRYDMDSDWDVSSKILTLNKCREYVGLGDFNGNLYLKFNDNVSCDSLSSEDSQGGKVQTRKSDKVGYQKIETFLQNQSEIVKNHKSNFFSVRIGNTKYGNPEQYESDISDIRYKQAKKDIVNAIRRIVENVSPVNTTLVDVQFQD